MSFQAVVLLSGGLDSVFNLYAAHQKWPGQVLALNLNYGQKAWESEKNAALWFAERLSIPMQTLDIANVFLGGKSALTSDEQVIPTLEVDINSAEASAESALKVWVANRNGVLLNIAACLAEKVGAQFIVPGFNAEEAATFPDNSVAYIEKMNECFKYSTSNGVQIHCFSQLLNKSEIIKQLVAMESDLSHVWSCYYSGSEVCGQCESCQRYQRAFKSLNL